ncbi:uncharacterized protein [Watersipora subatra]|uniref:uncharacterized protein isoform X1 n=1 Tax=Watersipora subatra TaxID=2589382 RepID=UPI00355B28ED
MAVFSLFTITLESTSEDIKQLEKADLASNTASIQAPVQASESEKGNDTESAIFEQQSVKNLDNDCSVATSDYVEPKQNCATEAENVACSDSEVNSEDKLGDKQQLTDGGCQPSGEGIVEDISSVEQVVEETQPQRSRQESEDSTDEYVSAYSREKLLQDILQRFKIKTSTWMRSIDTLTILVTFAVEAGRKEEDVLDALVACGFGKEPGTSVSISPTTVCLRGEQACTTKKSTVGPKQCKSLEDGTAETVTATDSLNALPSADQIAPLPPSPAMRVDFADDPESEMLLEAESDGVIKKAEIEQMEKSDFFKSIKARIIVQPIIAALRQNAEFTFDYLVFVVLASIIGAVGLIENSSVILVASMLISPLMGPILAATFGSAIEDPTLRNVGLKSEAVGLAVCVLTGFLLGLPVTYIMNSESWWKPITGSWPSPEMYGRGLPRSLIVGAVIALVSGMAVALSVLGNNQGSLVGVAISASLLPPAVNCGLLWAYSLQSAISYLVMPQYNNTGMGAPRVSVDAVEITGDDMTCDLLYNNTYVPYFTCNMAQETFYLGLISLLLTVLNIGIIVAAAMCCLKVKQVSPRASVSNEQVFWTKHMKVAKHYNTTVRPSTDYWTTMVKEMKANLKVTDEEAERILDDGRNARRKNPWDLPETFLQRSKTPDQGFRQRKLSLGSQSATGNTNFSRLLSHQPKLETVEFEKRSLEVKGRFKVEKKKQTSTQNSLA